MTNKLQNGASLDKSEPRLFDKHSGLLTAKDVSQQLAVSVKAVYRWAKEYRVPCVIIGRCVRFRPEDIEEIVIGRRRLL
jgi:excisionase family DNA binding protein